MSGTKLLVMTYNIHSGKDINGRYSLDKIIKFIQCVSPDVLALQEINENRVRGFQISQIKRELNYYLHFGSNMELHGGQYGIATLTKLPIIKKEHIILPSLMEQRGMIHSTIFIEDQNINIYNTHLGLSNLERYGQLNIINKFIKKHSLKSNPPILLLGDFNTTMPLYNRSLLYDTDTHVLPTIIGFDKKIDYILVSHHIKVLNFEVIKVEYSDHFPLLAEIVI